MKRLRFSKVARPDGLLSHSPKNMPTLSVFMPNYNHSALLPRAIEAIVKQSRRPDEFVIIDDGSIDNSVEVIKTYQKKFPFITLWQNETNQGLLSIMESIPQRLQGEYIFGASADDYVLPGFFATAMKLAARWPRAGILFGEMVVVDPKGRELYIGRASRWHGAGYITTDRYREEFLAVEPPGHGLTASLIYKRDSLLQVGGFRPSLKAWSDVFAARAMGLKDGAIYIPQPCAVWTVQPGSVSHQARKSLRESLLMIARASALMRSPQFQPYFPEWLVRRWEREYRLASAGRYLASRLVGDRGYHLSHRLFALWRRSLRLRLSQRQADTPNQLGR